MGVSKPVFTCIKTKAVDNVQRWVDKNAIIYIKIDDLKDYYFHFLYALTSDM